MWLFTTVGFFSVVQKPNQDGLTVRARIKEDLDRLRAKYMPQLSPTITGEGTDYQFRATISHDDFAFGLAKVAHDITYANFKNEIAKRQGVKREAAYHQVWDALHAMEEEVKPVAKGKKAPKVVLQPAYGGVVINRHGQVLLFQPRDLFGGMVWTFPKGRPGTHETPQATAVREVFEETGVRARIERPLEGAFDGTSTVTSYFLMSLVRDTGQPGTHETPQATAVREVFEETGVRARIERPLEGAFDGTSTVTSYFLMSLVRDTGQPGKEAQAVKWVTEDEAEAMLGQSTTIVSRDRDLQVLHVAFDLYRSRTNR